VLGRTHEILGFEGPLTSLSEASYNHCALL